MFNTFDFSLCWSSAAYKLSICFYKHLNCQNLSSKNVTYSDKKNVRTQTTNVIGKNATLQMDIQRIHWHKLQNRSGTLFDLGKIEDELHFILTFPRNYTIMRSFLSLRWVFSLFICLGSSRTVLIYPLISTALPLLWNLMILLQQPHWLFLDVNITRSALKTILEKLDDKVT